MTKMLYVISDLHIGGDYADATAPAGRGFRLCTNVERLTEFVQSLSRAGNRDSADIELVINGDFVDFLAEKQEVRDPITGKKGIGWMPLIEDPSDAVRTLQRIIARDEPFFIALRDFLAVGNRLTILLGNHDIELSFPAVRQYLSKVLAVDERRFSFIFDGEAYIVGKVLIEHGNRYDQWNVVTHDALRRFRSAQSRKEPALEPGRHFQAPAGSFLVAGIMNEIKQRYPFVDLLKPENEAVIPILLALAPEYRRHLFSIAQLRAISSNHAIKPDGRHSNAGDVGDKQGLITREISGQILVSDILRAKIPPQHLDDFVESVDLALPANDSNSLSVGDIGYGIRSTWSLVKLLSVDNAKPISSRLPALLTALEATRDDFSFEREQESDQYLVPAKQLLANGFQVVVFGHTHLAKEIRMEMGTYINTGTWADVLPFPTTILDTNAGTQTSSAKESNRDRLDRLSVFINDMSTSKLDNYVKFIPTYARIELDSTGEVVSARLCDYGDELEGCNAN